MKSIATIQCAAHENPPDTDAPANLDYDLWTGPAPMRPYNKLVHPRSWRAFMEYSNGIVGDMCVHMLDMTRWMMGLGWPKTVSSSGGIFVDKASKANTSDTQTATFEFPEVPVIWQHRTWGSLPSGFAFSADKESKPGSLAHPRYPWGATFYGDKGTLECSVMGYTFTPNDKSGGEAIHKDVVYELEEYPEDKTEKDLEKHVAPAIRGHMKNLLECIGTREKPVADIEQGYISTASCILANLSMKLGRQPNLGRSEGSDYQRRRSQQAAGKTLPTTLDPPCRQCGVRTVRRSAQGGAGCWRKLQMVAPLPTNEAERLRELEEFQVLDTAQEQEYDDLVHLASQICGTPIALMSLIDSNRQWWKSRIGLPGTQTHRDIAFCSHAILQPDVTVVKDARTDDRFADNPLVKDDPSIRFYAGAPLVTLSGHAMGTLCVIDRVPRELTDAQKRSLEALSRQAVMLLELRRAKRATEEANQKQNELLHKLDQGTEEIGSAPGKPVSARHRGATAGRALRQHCRGTSAGHDPVRGFNQLLANCRVAQARPGD